MSVLGKCYFRKIKQLPENITENKEINEKLHCKSFGNEISELWKNCRTFSFITQICLLKKVYLFDELNLLHGWNVFFAFFSCDVYSF